GQRRTLPPRAPRARRAERSLAFVESRLARRQCAPLLRAARRAPRGRALGGCMTDARSHMKDLVAVAAPYWAGEAEIVREYLASHRTRERDLVWLKAQAWKETRLLRELSPEAQRDYFATNAISEHPEGHEAV